MFNTALALTKLKSPCSWMLLAYVYYIYNICLIIANPFWVGCATPPIPTHLALAFASISRSPSELVTPLSVGEETGEAPSGAVVEPHVELRLKRLIGAFDVTQTAGTGRPVGGVRWPQPS